MFQFTKQSLKSFQNLDQTIQKNIHKKLIEIKQWWWGDFKTIKWSSIASHRLRISDYRLILQQQGDWYIVLDIWHRSQIYSNLS